MSYKMVKIAIFASNSNEMDSFWTPKKTSGSLDLLRNSTKTTKKIQSNDSTIQVIAYWMALPCRTDRWGYIMLSMSKIPSIIFFFKTFTSLPSMFFSLIKIKLSIWISKTDHQWHAGTRKTIVILYRLFRFYKNINGLKPPRRLAHQRCYKRMHECF